MKKQCIHPDRLCRLLNTELHDGLAGTATNIAFLTALARNETAPEKKDALLDQLRLLAEEASREVRWLMNVFEHSTMRWSDVICSLRHLCSELLEGHHHTLTVLDEGTPPAGGPGLQAGMSIARVVREGLKNTIHHAEADRIELRLRFAEDAFVLTLSDNGRGFDPGSVRQGRGLRIMERRTGELNGSLSIESEGGTRLTLKLPLNEHAGVPPAECEESASCI